MKRIFIIALILMASAGSAFAATTEETLKNESKKWGDFWSREGERSGLKESTSSWGKFWSDANPATFFRKQKESYEARKAGAPVSGVTTK
jgi:hypothetical protein